MKQIADALCALALLGNMVLIVAMLVSIALGTWDWVVPLVASAGAVIMVRFLADAVRDSLREDEANK